MLNLNSDDIFSLWSLRQNQTNELQEFHFVIIRLEYKFGQYSAPAVYRNPHGKWTLSS